MGVSLHAAGDYTPACVQFAASTQAMATKSGLFNLANCRYELHRYVDATRSLERLQAEFGDQLPPGMASKANTLRKNLETELSRLSVTVVPVGAAVTLEDEALVPGAWVAPGIHRLLLPTPDTDGTKRKSPSRRECPRA